MTFLNQKKTRGFWTYTPYNYHSTWFFLWGTPIFRGLLLLVSGRVSFDKPSKMLFQHPLLGYSHFPHELVVLDPGLPRWCWLFLLFFSPRRKRIYIYIYLYTVKIYIHNKYICINKYIHKIYNVFINIYIYVISHIIYRRMCSDINHLDINPIDML